jgi:hypothetical protein
VETKGLSVEQAVQVYEREAAGTGTTPRGGITGLAPRPGPAMPELQEGRERTAHRRR